MPRELVSTKLAASLSAVVQNAMENNPARIAYGTVSHSLETTLQSGIESGQADRAWEWLQDLEDGESITIDLTTFSGYDLGAGDGKDILGQDMGPLVEVVSVTVSNNNEYEDDDGNDNEGFLEITPGDTNGWTPIGSHTVAVEAALGPQGSYAKTSIGDPAFAVSNSSRTIKLTANGGAVNCTISIIGRHDDIESSSSSQSASSQSSSSSSSRSSSSSFSSSSSSISSSSSHSSSSFSSDSSENSSSSSGSSHSSNSSSLSSSSASSSSSSSSISAESASSNSSSSSVSSSSSSSVSSSSHSSSSSSSSSSGLGYCSGCGSAPQTFTVSSGGTISNGTCSNCSTASINVGTVLTNYQNCKWQRVHAGSACGDGSDTTTFELDWTFNTSTFTVQSAGLIATYSASGCPFAGMSLNFVSASGACSGWPAFIVL